MPPFILSRYTAKKTARFVSEIGTGLNGRGMDNGPRMQSTAVISPARVRRLILVPVFCCGFSADDDIRCGTGMKIVVNW